RARLVEATPRPILTGNSLMANDDQSNRPRPAVRAPSRFGPTAIVREGPPSEDVHLLALFVAEAVCDFDSDEEAERPPGRSFPERRQSPRFRPAEQQVWLGWWSTAGHFTRIDARLENISKG